MGAGKDGRGPWGPVVTATVAAAVAVVIAVFYVSAPRATPVKAGDLAPDFTLPSVLGGFPKLSESRGSPTVLVFLDTGGSGSEAYAQNLRRLDGRYWRRGLRITAVALDAEADAVREFIRRNDLRFTVLSDPGGAIIARSYGTPRGPEAYFLDPAGRVEAVFTQPFNWADPAVKAMLEKDLKPELPGW